MSKTRQRRGRAIRSPRGVVSALLAAIVLLMLAAPASQAVTVANPGPISAYVTSGLLRIGTTAFEIGSPDNTNCPPPQPVSAGCNPRVQGAVAADGKLSITGVAFPQAVLLGADTGQSFDITVSILPVLLNQWSGSIDPLTGTSSLRGYLQVQLTGGSGLTALGDSCYIGGTTVSAAIPLNLTTGTMPSIGTNVAVTGTPYDQAAGTLTGVDNTLTVPGAGGCGLLGLGNSSVNGALGLPAAAGTSEAALTLQVDPKVLSAVRPAFTFSPDEGRAPAQVAFDASSTQVDSAITGPATAYTWDFGDDTDPVTTAGPITSHTYANPGIYTASLKVTTEDGSFKTIAKTVTVKGVVVGISAKPAALTNATSATFGFASADATGGFQCSLDGATYETCATGVEYDDLEAGDHTFRVRGLDGSGAGLPTEYGWTVDTEKPVPSITSGPAAKVNGSVTDGDVAFTATDNESDSADVTYECRYDFTEDPDQPEVDGWQACTSPQHVAWEAVDGDRHTFEVRAIDQAGNVSDPVVRSWTVDTTPPSSTVTGTPLNTLTSTAATVTNPTNQNATVNAQFAFSSSEPGSFVCQFNGAAERACQSPIQTGTGTGGTPSQTRLGAQSQGINTFKVWAVDAAGNRDPIGQTYAYTYDSVAPTITLFNTPTQVTNQTSFSVIASSNEPIADDAAKPAGGFECSTANTASYTKCDLRVNAVTASFPRTGLAQGTYTLRVRATDLAGNVSAPSAANGGLFPTSGNLVIDLTAPGAPTITGGPLSGSSTNATSASFTSFSSTDTGGSTAANTTYQCRLDTATFTACPGAPVAYSGLTNGAHTFGVRAVDQAGNAGAESIRTWTIGVGSVTLSDKPAAQASSTAASFSFDTSGADSYECRGKAATAFTDDTGWAACTSPKTYSGLAQGQQFFEVRSVTGSVKGFPTVYGWIVDTTAPAGMAISNSPGNGSGRTDAVTTAWSPTFSATDANGVTYECRYDSAAADTWQPCTSPGSVTWPLTNNATHTYDVRATDPAGNVSAVATKSWTVDTVVPTASARWAGADIISAVTTTSGSTATAVVYSSNESLVSAAAGFVCQFNTSAERNCASIAAGVSTPATESGVQISTGSQTASGVLASQTRLGAPVQGVNTVKVWTVDQAGNRSANPATVSFTYDTAQPVVTAVSPATNIQVNTPPASYSFVFTSNETVNRFECSLNSTTAFSLCTGSGPGGAAGSASGATGTAATHAQVVPNTEGTYTVRVRGVDLASPGNVSSGNNIATYNVVVDKTAPVVSVSAGPADGSITTAASPSFTYATTTEAGSVINNTFECRLDSSSPSGWTACGSTSKNTAASTALADLADGTHTFSVRATDGAGNVGTPVTRTWTVDTTGPVTSIDDKPASVTKSPDADISFSANEDASFECRLDSMDDAAWEVCTSPVSYTGLAAGDHSFDVRATDTAGNLGAVKSYSWTIDVVAPVGHIVDHPDTLSTSTDATFAFSSNKSGSTFECRLDSSAGADWAACDSPHTYHGLADGDHSFEVKPTDGAGNEGEPVSFDWTIDSDAPSVTIVDGPTGTVEETAATFTFSSNDADATFACKLDGGSYAACSSPVTVSELEDGEHTLAVKAADEAGNSSTDERTWTVRKPTDTTPTDTTPTDTTPTDTTPTDTTPTDTTPTTPTIPTTPTTPTTTTPVPPPAKTPVVSVATAKLKVAKGVTTLKVRCSAAACSGRVTVTYKAKGAKKQTKLTSVAYKAAAGKSATVKVKVSKKALAALKKVKGKAALQVTVSRGRTVGRTITIK